MELGTIKQIAWIALIVAVVVLLGDWLLPEVEVEDGKWGLLALVSGAVVIALSLTNRDTRR